VKIAMLAASGSVHTARWSRGLISRGYEILLISNSASTQSPPDVPAQLLPGRSSLAYLRNIPSVRRVIKGFAPDIVHAHYATGYGLWGASQHVAPLVVSVWGTDVADALAGRFMVRSVVRRALHTAQAVTATSRFLMEQTIHLEPSVKNKIIHIPFGLPESDFIRHVDRSDGGVQIIFAKRYTQTYGPDIALRAFAAAYKKNPHICLLMLGGGPMRKKLESLAVSLSVASAVEIRDWIEPEETRRFIAESDIMLMPSRQESFGVAALEASAAGIPIIASDVGGVPEIVRHERNGLLVPCENVDAFADAIVRLAGDPALRKTMGEAGISIARGDFSMDRCLDLMEEVYTRTAG
jgi:glycosyltransferase involved in cell wall biosynthesis